MNSEQILGDILEFAGNLPDITELDSLLDYILKKTRDFVNADGGTVYIKQNNNLVFTATQNDTIELIVGKDIFRKNVKNFSIPINKNSISGYCALKAEPVNIKDTKKMPCKFEFRFNREFDKKYNYKTSTILAMPLINRKGEVVGVIQLINAMNPDNSIREFNDNDIAVLKSISSIIAMNLENSILHKTLLDSYIESLYKLGNAAEFKDNETSNHIKRVGEYSALIASQYGLSDKEVKSIALTAPMHDIGKIGISDGILLKPGRFTDQEREIMKCHTVIGAEIFKEGKNEIDFYSRIVALCHHEMWDGSGYPLGLVNKDIPLIGRIVSAADVFDALASRRVYKEAWNFDDVVDYIHKMAGAQFDPKISEIICDNKYMFNKILISYNDTNILEPNEEIYMERYLAEKITINIRFPKYSKEHVLKHLKDNPIAE